MKDIDDMYFEVPSFSFFFSFLFTTQFARIKNLSFKKYDRIYAPESSAGTAPIDIFLSLS